MNRKTIRDLAIKLGLKQPVPLRHRRRNAKGRSSWNALRETTHVSSSEGQSTIKRSR
jgi:hypothetical protein